jgi:hypothetical protein
MHLEIGLVLQNPIINAFISNFLGIVLSNLFSMETQGILEIYFWSLSRPFANKRGILSGNLRAFVNPVACPIHPSQWR